MKYLFSFIIIIFYFKSFSQEKIIAGQVLVNKNPAENVHVSNLTKNYTTISNQDGKFNIQGEIGDLIVFSAVHLDFWRQSIKKNDYESGLMTVNMTEKTTELEEIEIVEYPNINAKDLGIINYTPKKYTPAERRYFTATSTVIDHLLNWFSGRKKILKQGIEIEKKQFLLEELTYYTDKNYLINEMKIPEDYAEGFLYYAVEFPEIIEAVKTKNKEQIRFKMTELSQSFLTYLKSNQKTIEE
jgi:hypothetical protein